MSHYDGRSWRFTPGSSFAPTGRLLHPDADAGDAGRYYVVIGGLSGPFLPVPDRPVAVNDESLLYDPATQTLVDPDGATRGDTHTVARGFEAPEDAALVGDEIVTAPSPTADGFQCVDAFADAIAARAIDESSPLSTLWAFESFLRDDAGFVSDPQRSVSGHSLGQMTRLIRSNLITSGVAATSRLGLECDISDGGPAASSNVGTSEQFASLFALMARSRGLQARVAVGFLVPAGGGTLPITGEDAVAWPEILFRRTGWVSFDPLPSGGGSVPGKGPVLEGSAGSQPDPARSAPRGPSPSGKDPDEERDDALPPWIAIAAGAAGAAAFLLPPAIVFLKLVRSRRRWSKTDPRERVVAAWDETLDRLVERGVSLAASVTASDVGRLSRRVIGAQAELSLAVLVGCVNAAAFGAGRIDPQVADRAWATHHSILSDIRSRESRLMRARAALSIRPFRY